MEIRQATISDVKCVVDLHCSAFNGFFLTSLGIEFLTFYYKSFIKSNDTIVVVAEDNGVLLGFSATSKKSEGFNKRLILSNLYDFGLLTIRLLCTNPKSLIRIIRNLNKKGENVNICEDYAELYSIGVSKDAQGLGIGKKIILETECLIKKCGINKISLTTDFFNNEKTLGFYKSVGYDVLYEFIAYPNRKMYRLYKKL